MLPARGVVTVAALRALAGTARPALAQGWVPSDGEIRIARATMLGKDVSSVSAYFVRGGSARAVIGSDGPCVVHRGADGDRVSAGTIAVTGMVAPITLEPTVTGKGLRYQPSAPAPIESFADGATITVAASGGSDVPAFTTTVIAPSALTGYVPSPSVARTGVTVTWTPGSAGEIDVTVGTHDQRTGPSTWVDCRVADTGSFTMSASTLAFLPDSDRVVVRVGRVATATTVVRAARIGVVVGDYVVSEVRMLPGVAVVEPATVPVPVQPGYRSPVSFGIGFGFGGFGRVGTTPSHGGEAAVVQFANPLGDRLRLIADVNFVTSSYSATFPTTISDFDGSVTIGLEWRPFPLPSHPWRFFDPHWLYLVALVGVDERHRDIQTSATADSSQFAWVPIGQLGIGLPEVKTRTWELGVELRGELGYTTGELERGLQLLFVAHMFGG